MHRRYHQPKTDVESQSKLKPICTLRHHTNDITSIDFAGRNLLATGSSDKTVRIYKWQPDDTFVELPHSPLKGHRYGINCISFSPFGSKLASGSTDGLTIIWDVKTGQKISSLQLFGKSAGVRACAFSNNSAFLATGGDDDIAAVWDVSTLSLLRELGGHESTVTCISFTPDSVYLATGSSSGDLKLWDGVYGHALPLVTKAEVHDLGIATLHFSPSLGKEESFSLGKEYLLATGGQDTDLHLWVVKVGSQVAKSIDPKTGTTNSASVKLHHTLCGHKEPVMMVKFNYSGTILASASGDKTVRLWDVMKLTPLATLEGHLRYVTCCAFSDDSSLLAAGGGDRCAHIWKVEEAMKAARAISAISAAQMRDFLHNFPSQRFRENKKLCDWSLDDVCDWLTEQGLAEYCHNFRSEAIDGRELTALTDDVLENKLSVDAMGHRNKILRLVSKSSKEHFQFPFEGSGRIPSEFYCPIAQELMVDPVLCADGFSYERKAMEAWLAGGKRTSPMTNDKLLHLMLTPNRTLRNLIQKYKEEHP